MRLRLSLAGFLPATLLLAACGSSKQQASSTASRAPVWGGIPLRADVQGLVASFNDYLDARTGPASPTQLALEFVGADRTQAATTTTRADAAPEGGGPTTVTVVQDRLADDSVRATRDILRFAPDGGAWRLRSAERARRCQPGRGHQQFAAGDCV